MEQQMLFDRDGTQPLAARLRPRTLDEFVGQRHLLGPGKVLTGFTKKIAKGMTALNVEDPASLEKTLAALKA